MSNSENFLNEDEDLLNQDDGEDDDYDLDYEREEALLQEEEEEEVSNENTSQINETTADDEIDIEEDILVLDPEEELHDVEEKTDEYNNENQREDKFAIERSQADYDKIIAKKDEFVPEKNRSNYKKSSNWRRYNNSRGSYQTKYSTNSERRNKTVLINPRYQGFVHVNDNNARLAWDNHSSQNSSNYIQPWASGSVPSSSNQQQLDSSKVLSNFVSTVAGSFQQTIQNAFQRSTTNLFQVPQQFTFHSQQTLFQGSQLPQTQLQFTQQNIIPPLHQNYNNQVMMGTQNYQNPQQMLGTFNNNSQSQQQYSNQDNLYQSGNYFNHQSTCNDEQQQQQCYSMNNRSYHQNYNNDNNNSSSNGLNFEPPQRNYQKNFRGRRINNRGPFSRNSFSRNSGNNSNNRRNVFQQKRNLEDSTNKFNQHRKIKPLMQVQTSNKFDDFNNKYDCGDDGDNFNDVDDADDDYYEEEDEEEARVYRLMIEEQKREREKVLQMKEERRKLLIQQKQQQQQTSKITVVSSPNRSYNNNNRTKNSSSMYEKFNERNNLIRPEMSSNLTTITSCGVSNFMSNRIVSVKNIPIINNNDDDDDNNKIDKKHLTSFLSNRKILAKDNSLIETRLVVVSNLSASTTNVKLMGISRGIGEIEKIQMDQQERQATILFKNVASAHAFFKKYQRSLLDLSVIEVNLQPMI